MHRVLSLNRIIFEWGNSLLISNLIIPHKIYNIQNIFFEHITDEL